MYENTLNADEFTIRMNPQLKLKFDFIQTAN